MNLATVYQHLFKRRLPFGLFSWRFLLPNQTPTVLFHRRLVMEHFPQTPRLVFFSIVLFSGLKWAFFYSPYYTFKVVKHRGKALKEETGLGLWQQYFRVLSVSSGHGLAAHDWYRYRLYDLDSNKSMWDYVYEQEVGAFHHYRNRGRPHYKEHVALLGDKHNFESLLKQHGIQTVRSLTILPQHTLDFHAQLTTLTCQYGELFCKRRTGNHGRGAFRTYIEEECLGIEPRNKVPLPESKITTFLHENISQHDYLIQPYYKNHHRLQTITQGYLNPASTIRIIGHCHDDQISLEFAVMYWPVVDNEQQVRFHYPIAIEPHSGKLDRVHRAWPQDSLDKTQLMSLNQLIDNLNDKPLPHWSEAIKLACLAHPLLTGVDRIAWDLILTEERAVLLEGNSGWGGLATCQWFGYNVKCLTP